MTAAYVGRDGATYPIDVPRWSDDARRPLMTTPLAGIGPADIDRGTRSLWRYRAALPVDVADPITLGEGVTPLVERRFDAGTALCKLEWFAPTGSFKDRGASVMLSTLRQQGVTAVLEDSSGNGGAAIAAYARAGGMQAKILVPAYTQPAKTVQMLVHDADVELVPGVREDTAAAALRQSEEIFYASHNWQAFFLHGTKTLGYELWEDLDFRAPDAIVIPTGAGSNVLGCDLAFTELQRAGQIDRLPRLYAAQPEHCGPIAASWAAGHDSVAPIDPRPTVAEGTAIAAPVRGFEVLAALRRSGGGACAVSEAEIMSAHGTLADHGLYAEPTCASALAAYERLRASGEIGADESCVLVLTGTGLKATQMLGERMGVLPGSNA